MVESRSVDQQKNDMQIFYSPNDCVYFSLGVLNKQKFTMALLDLTTIRVLMDNERLLMLDDGLKSYLVRVSTHKLKLDAMKSNYDTAFHISGNNMNVAYEQENDTKNNFPSVREFTAFNKQRDLFYNILR